MPKTVAIIGTLDTKGAEFQFLKEQVETCGCNAIMIDCGVVGKPYFTPDISNTEVAAAGGSFLKGPHCRKRPGPCNGGYGVRSSNTGAQLICSREN